MIGEDVVANSIGLRVTRTGVCQVYFDRTQIRDYATENNLTEEVNVTISGYYTHEPIGGGNISGIIEFTGEGVVFFR